MDRRPAREVNIHTHFAHAMCPAAPIGCCPTAEILTGFLKVREEASQVEQHYIESVWTVYPAYEQL